MMKYFLFLIVVLASLNFSASAQTCPDTTNFRLENGVCLPVRTGLSEASVKDVITNVLEWLLGIFGILGIITFLISGAMYLTAAGDADQEKKAKNAMKMGIMGMIVGLAGFVVIQAVDAILNAEEMF